MYLLHFLAANLQSVRQRAYKKAYFSNYFWFSDRVWFSVSSSRILSSSLQSVSYGPSQRRRWHSTKQWCCKMGIKTRLLTSQNWPLHEYLRKTVSQVKMQIKPRNFCLSCYFQGILIWKALLKNNILSSVESTQTQQHSITERRSYHLLKQILLSFTSPTGKSNLTNRYNYFWKCMRLKTSQSF